MERLPALALADRARVLPGIPMPGVPALPMPEHVLDAVRHAAGRVRPRQSWGTPELRRAIAEHLGGQSGLAVDPDRELLVTHGAQQGMSVVLRALLATGDEVLVPAPTYFFDGMVRMAGARPVYVPGRPEHGWATDVDGLRGAVTPATRAILLCNPNNPTGHTPSRDELSAVLALASEHGLLVLADESYARYVHSGPGYAPQQLLRGEWPELVTVTSLSKNYAFTQWRIGYVHAPAHLAERVHRAFEWDAINVGDVPQAAACAVLSGPQDWLDVVFASFRQRRDQLCAALDAAGLPVVRPDSGIFVFPDLSVLGRRGRDLEDLLLRAGIPGVAGDAFQGPGTHARLLYGGAEADLAEAGKRLAALAG
ncbi:pyridoxal phosphate-dependent aminotransferase [Amycolatopsis rubida]|uniref:Aspartate aminotransferase/aminotransferase n=1 Tax=Amycolatopsis rubida TaxID=112413 RepID=A0A1I5FG47_9PSEU|nr:MULTISPECIES: pyridoxal phosphate-dependent aminotransferase [Amycolatopsis]MYW91899.1 aminotransferase class I/II-fold pyridoxal phosphate-dependent enzyme [Amycolatopsis rubida]NEC56884.1 pyridoxal phosphate-dependent aminotransferase [Amycolatopsis rubida]OAP27944.1 Aspartate aminotransferase [Amycolatopsis sp. M39]SFO22672.1 aspartate aminotransferase/aminotransferase [Amycolatopsis rubida]